MTFLSPTHLARALSSRSPPACFASPPSPSSAGDRSKKEEKQRLDRILSNRGIGSRTEATTLIKRGKVRSSTGEVLRSPSAHVNVNAILYVGEQEVRPMPLLLAYHKPVGIHSTIGDPLGRPNLETVLPPRYKKAFHPVGRLDADTSGLLLFSADGRITHRLLHPSTGVEREYLAVVEGEVEEASLRARLEAGVETTEGTFEAKVLECRQQVVRLVVQEGKYRMVRRILNNAGHPVVDLHRVRYGEIRLGDLQEGAFLELHQADEWARDLLHGPGKAGKDKVDGGGGGGDGASEEEVEAL